MSPGVEALLRFASEFAVFLVAVAGLALAMLRPELLVSRVFGRLLLLAGFAALAATAFVHGSLLVADPDQAAFVAARAGGWLAAGIASMWWSGRRASQRAVLGGTILGVSGTVADLAGEPLAGAGLQSAAALAGALALVQATRRTVATRIAAASAATLLLVVLVLSVGLSAVLVNTVEEQALAALDNRAVREAGQVEAARERAIEAALSASITVTRDPDLRAAILAVEETGVISGDQQAAVLAVLDLVEGNALGETIGLAYADERAGVIAGAAERPFFRDLVDSATVGQARTEGRAVGGVALLDERAVALGVVPVVATPDPGSGEGIPLGVILAAVEIDSDYLGARARAEDRVDLAIWTSDRQVAATGDQPRPGMVERRAEAVLDGADGTTIVASDRLVAVRAIRTQDNRPLLALVASRPATAVDQVRERLFRTFFVIAFGGTVLALLLAALVGERIGAGLRRLTASAEALERGESGVRSNVRTPDEVGRLGTAFDAMAESIEDKTQALRQAALDEAELRNRLQAVVAGMGEALVAFGTDGRITDFNEAAAQLTGVGEEEATGRQVGEVFELIADEGGDATPGLRDGGDVRWSAIAELRTEASTIPVAITVGPLRAAGGEVVGRVAVLRDLRSEQEIERMKREFLSRVGHELRTPLTPLLGYARILAGREVDPSRTRQLAATMVASGERLQRIVELLEFFASLEAGRTRLSSTPVDVRNLLAQAIDRIEAGSNAPSRVSRRVRRGTPPVVGDGYWLARSVQELVDNALKFSPGGGKVSVTAQPAGRFVEIAVKDGGVGMSADQQDRAFTEWTQGDESDTRSYGGLGLGLALVTRVVERHGGSITCDSAEGKGSTFRILLPVASRPGGAGSNFEGE